MDGNQWKKYTLYAVGEILLVVIGILLALQINNWNESRKASALEILYLNRIRSENKQDMITFAEAIENLERGKRSVEDFSEALKSTHISETLLLQKASEYFKFGSIYPVFTSSTSTFEDLSSTGNLQVIKNTKLREAIVHHYALHKRVKERIQIGIEWSLLLDAPFTYDHDIMQYEPLTAFLFPETEAKEFAGHLTENKTKYISNAAAHFWVNEDSIIHFKELMQATEMLISAIEKELGYNVN